MLRNLFQADNVTLLLRFTQFAPLGPPDIFQLLLSSLLLPKGSGTVKEGGRLLEHTSLGICGTLSSPQQQ